MRTLPSISAMMAVLALGAAACGGTPETAPAVDETAARAALDTLEAAFIEAYNAGDAAALAGLWAEDGTFSPPLSPTLERTQIQSAYTEQFAAGAKSQLQVNREDVIFSAAGDRAASWGSFIVNGTGPDGAEFTAWGRYGNVLQKQADGSWKILRHMYNWETPPPGYGQPQK